MSLLDELGISDLGAVNMKEQEEKISSGGLCPAGVHQAILDGARVIMIDNVKRGYELKFKVIAGPAKDAMAEDALWLPKGEDKKKDDKANNRCLIFGKRLGLFVLTKDSSGVEKYALAPGKGDYCDCLGAIVMIEVKHEEEEYEKDGRKRTITKAKLEWEGILKPDDKKCKDAKLATGTAIEAAKSSSSKPVSKPVDNLADL